jgi:hypothetical protein
MKCQFSDILQRLKSLISLDEPNCPGSAHLRHEASASEINRSIASHGGFRIRGLSVIILLFSFLSHFQNNVVSES